MRKLASLIAKYEGKKSQAKIGEIREILKIIAVLRAHDVAHGTDSISGAALDEFNIYTGRVSNKYLDLIEEMTPPEAIDKLLGKKAKVRK